MPRSVPSPFWTDTCLPCDLSHEELSTDKHSPASCDFNVLCHDLCLLPFEQTHGSPAIWAMRNSARTSTALLLAILMFYATICTFPPFEQACVSPAISAMRSSALASTALLLAILLFYATICTSPHFEHTCGSPAIWAMRNSARTSTALLLAIWMFYATICVFSLLNRHMAPLWSEPWGTQHWQAQPCFLRY